jgi:SAM-dependent methyltransferase
MNHYPNGVVLESCSCPNGCNEFDEVVIRSKDYINNLPGEFTIVKCKCCALERTNPRPSAETIGYYYPDSYAPYMSAPIVKSENTKGLLGWIKSKVAINDKVLPHVAKGRLLEFGCANGNYLVEMREKGWEVEGIEYSQSAAQTAIDRGLEVEVGSIESAQPRGEKYNVVVAWMVMEHLHDPIFAMRKIRGWIVNDGYFVFSIPNSNSIARKLFKDLSYDLHLPNHLYHYSDKTIVTLLENCGWELVNIRWQDNAFTFLRSLKRYLDVNGHSKASACVSKLIEKDSRFYAYLRFVLHKIFGFLKLSGRIEVTAKPRCKNG